MKSRSACSAWLLALLAACGQVAQPAAKEASGRGEVIPQPQEPKIVVVSEDDAIRVGRAWIESVPHMFSSGRMEYRAAYLASKKVWYVTATRPQGKVPMAPSSTTLIVSESGEVKLSPSR